MTDNLIQWPKAKYWDKPWNPVIGCSPCSPACEHCYAAALATRFNQSFTPHASAQKSPPKKGVCFCGNLTDLFGGWEYKCDMAERIGQCVNRGATAYLWLTKRVHEMCYVLNNEKVLLTPFGGDEDSADWYCFDAPECNLSNHYFGFTAENQEWYDKRMSIARESFPEWAKLWISVEPMLGPIDMRIHESGTMPLWVVVGSESGKNRRQCKIEWVEVIVEQCMTAKVPVFVKQLDINGRCETDINKFPAHLRIRQVPWANEQEIVKCH